MNEHIRLRIAGLVLAAAIMPVVGYETLGKTATQLPPSSATIQAAPALSPPDSESRVSDVAVTINLFDGTP